MDTNDTKTRRRRWNEAQEWDLENTLLASRQLHDPESIYNEHEASIHVRGADLVAADLIAQCMNEGTHWNEVRLATIAAALAALDTIPDPDPEERVSGLPPEPWYRLRKLLERARMAVERTLRGEPDDAYSFGWIAGYAEATPSMVGLGRIVVDAVGNLDHSYQKHLPLDEQVEIAVNDAGDVLRGIYRAVYDLDGRAALVDRAVEAAFNALQDRLLGPATEPVRRAS